MYFFSIILLVGILTTYTDLINRKIKNDHLLLGAVLGTAAIIYTAMFEHADVLFHAINGFAAFLLGFILYRTNIWRGGDAKLFTLYAFLMPLPNYNLQPFPSVFSLFVCSFLGGSIILLPAFLKDLITNHKLITQELFLPTKRQALFLGIGGMIFFSWALFPLYYFSRVTNPVVILTILYLIFNWAYNEKKEVKKHYIADFFIKNLVLVSSGILFGFIMRLWLSPNSLSLEVLARYFVQITLFSVVSTCIHTILNHFKKYQERVPFAPLIFMGCLLSYSPFLHSAISMVHRINN